MNADLFYKFSKFKIGSSISAEDFSDRMNFQISPFIMVLMTTLIGVRQYIFTPIQCWTPHEWSRAWEEYAENFCWVENTYFADTFTGPPTDEDTKERQRINYYQWVPFVLALQGLCFYLPHVLWKQMTAKTGTHINHLVKYASEAANFDQEKKDKVIKFVAKEILKMMNSKRHDFQVHGCCQSIRDKLSTTFPVFSKRSGLIFLVIYIFIKIIYLGNCFLQIYIMKSFIQHESCTFGFDILMNLIEGRTWELTGIFPRTTWCDLKRKTIANTNQRTFMCVLPVNMLNEKIYVFLWFWIVLVFVLTFISIFVWIGRMVAIKNRKRLVKKYLRMMECIKNRVDIYNELDDSPETKQCLKTFIHHFMRQDGIFVIYMIGFNVGDMVAAEVTAQVWKLFKEEREKKLKDKEEHQNKFNAKVNGEIFL